MIVDSDLFDGNVISDEGELMMIEVEERYDTLSYLLMSWQRTRSQPLWGSWHGLEFLKFHLVDFGSSHNFINIDILKKNGLQDFALEPLVVSGH